MQFSDVLVPTDLSQTSLKSLEYAKSLVASDGEIYLLHVIDQDFVQRAVEQELGSSEQIIGSMRERAERILGEVIENDLEAKAKLNKMVVVGVPFVEILRIAKDLDFSLIVMSIRGSSSPLKEIFFGSTVDKVLRATKIPVVCIPA
ncbi:MAG: universal stress protein [Acidobacteriota bacterium]|nr:universal stress protein [Blastocatellia bacterium]MDW8412070.1 universal stress protein [Acidobacteriota bacterium]